MKLRSAAVAAALVIAVTACGGIRSDDAAKPTAVTKSSTSKDAGPHATPEQYASIVAKSKADIKKTIHQLVDECDWSSPGNVPRDPALISCQADPLALKYQALLLKLNLTAAGHRGGAKFIGSPPAEIAPLVRDTRASVTELIKADNRIGNGLKCVQHDGPDCRVKLFQFSMRSTTCRAISTPGIRTSEAQNLVEAGGSACGSSPTMCGGGLLNDRKRPSVSAGFNDPNR